MFLLNNTFLDVFYGYFIPSCHVPRIDSFTTAPELAGKVDNAFMYFLVISVVMLALVTLCMVYFAVKYRASKNPESKEVKEPLWLEITWTVIPTILVFVIFYVGWENFASIRKTPENVLYVKVVAHMWAWGFEYENGIKSDVLRVPAGRPVKLTITSMDVIHSLYIPDFKLKEDAVPGMETRMWIVADRKGEHTILCAEYCGQGHSRMRSKVIAMPENEFDRWYEGVEEEETKEHEAPELLEDNGCLGCHSTDGSKIVGPSFKGIYGRKTTVVTDGIDREIIVDEAYLKRSILHPKADIVKGYPGIMPSFEGKISEEEVNSIIQYLKTIQ